MTVTLIKSNGNEDSGIIALARVKHDDGSDITEANMTSINRTVSKKSDGSNVSGPTSLTLADVIHDPPIEDVRYGIIDPDETIQGMNFEDPVDDTNFPDGPEIYEILYLFETNSGFKFTLKVEHTVDNSIG